MRLRVHVAADQWRRRAQLQRVRPRHGADAVALPAHPWHHAAIIEAQREAQAHRHAVAAHHVHVAFVVCERHEIDQRDGAAGGFEPRFEHRGARPIAPPHAPHRYRGLDLPVTVLALPEQCRETRRAVELRQAQPVDGAVSGDQGAADGVADETVIFEERAHAWSRLLLSMR
jgi:hypothetical protein